MYFIINNLMIKKFNTDSRYGYWRSDRLIKKIFHYSCSAEEIRHKFSLMNEFVPAKIIQGNFLKSSSFNVSTTRFDLYI